MNKFNPWAFGIIFIIGSLCFLCFDTNFELLFYSNKKITTAVITNTKISHGLGGSAYVQYLNYSFTSDGELINGFKKTEYKTPWQHIGNTIKIKYSVKNPVINQILEFNNEYKTSNKKVYLNFKKEGYSQIVFINNLYFYKVYGKNGVLSRKDNGFFKKHNDTITFYNFHKKKTDMEFIRTQRGIINLNNMELFK